MHFAHPHPPDIRASAAAVAGGVAGGLSARLVVDALGSHCGAVLQFYGVCRPRPLDTSWALLIYVGLVVAGAFFGASLTALFTPTLKRFVGTGATDLPKIRVRGDYARIEWDAQGGIVVTDVEHSTLFVRSRESAGQTELPAGRYRFRVAAPGSWTLRIARG